MQYCMRYLIVVELLGLVEEQTSDHDCDNEPRRELIGSGVDVCVGGCVLSEGVRCHGEAEHRVFVIYALPEANGSRWWSNQESKVL